MAEEAFDVVVPLELEAGVYADDLAGSSNGHAIVLDFLAGGTVDHRVVTARVRVPATAAHEIRKALDRLIGIYELQYGEIRAPRQRGDE
jgi:hypothetical protein